MRHPIPTPEIRQIEKEINRQLNGEEALVPARLCELASRFSRERRARDLLVLTYNYMEHAIKSKRRKKDLSNTWGNQKHVNIHSDRFCELFGTTYAGRVNALVDHGLVEVNGSYSCDRLPKSYRMCSRRNFIPRNRM